MSPELEDTEEDELDEIILDDEIETTNFTTDLSNMAGAPYHPEISDYIKNTSVTIPRHSNHICETTATKSQHKQNLIYKDFEFKKENLMDILQKQTATEEFKVGTKGKFPDSIAVGPGSNFSRDIKWLKRANPVAAAAEKAYLDRDLFLMEKRRF